MTLTIILVVIVVFGLGILGWIFFKKLPKVRMVNPSTVKESRSRALKYEIMRQRVERSTGKQMQKVHKSVFQPIGTKFQNAVRGIAGKLTAVERSYQERRHKTNETKADDIYLSKLVSEGKKLMDKELWDRAEKQFIEVISNDPKHKDSYEHLGRLYFLKKDYKSAKQTFVFLKKLAPLDASVVASLGEVEQRLGGGARAFKYFQQAVELSPKNPKYLDFLITAAIEKKDLAVSKETLEVLKEVNPDNKKIETFEGQVRDLKKQLLGTK